MMGSTLFLVMILGGWSAAMLWGSVMAVRGRRMWATSLLMIGSICMLIGTLGAAAGTVLVFRYYSSAPGVILWISILLTPIGLLVATIGMVGVCARFGLTERRAEELEGLVMQLQQRVSSQP